MSDIAAMIISGTILLIFLIAHRSFANANRQRFQAVVNFMEFMKSVYPFKNTSEVEEETLLEEYKQNKRMRLVIGGNVIQDLSIAEWENIALMNGFSIDNPILFAVETPEYKANKDDDSEDYGILKFPDN